MSIRHRSDRPQAPWQYEWREGSKRQARSFPTKQEAEDYRAERLRQRRWGAHSPAAPSRMTLEGWVMRWIDTRAAEWADSTKRTRGSVLDLWIIPHIGHVPLRELGRARVMDWRSEIQRKGCKATTVNNALRVLSACLSAAVDEGLLPANPCQGMRRVKTVRREKPVLTPLEVERMREFMLTHAHPRDALLVSVLCYAGLRPSEALALTWGDVGHSLHVQRAHVDGKTKDTKTGRSRSVELCAPLAADLEALRPTRPAKGALVFPNTIGEEVDLHNWSNRTWRKAREALGVTAAPSDGRHTFASLLIHEGRSVVDVQHQLGHASASTTLDHYSHLFSEGRLAQNVRMVDAINQARAEVFGVRPEGGLRAIEGGGEG